MASDKTTPASNQYNLFFHYFGYVMIVLKHEHNNMNMRIMQCALCGKKEDVVLLYKENINPAKVNKKTYSARRIPEKVHFRLLQCKNCGLIVSSPIFPEDKIRFFYR